MAASFFLAISCDTMIDLREAMPVIRLKQYRGHRFSLRCYGCDGGSEEEDRRQGGHLSLTPFLLPFAGGGFTLLHHQQHMLKAGCVLISCVIVN